MGEVGLLLALLAAAAALATLADRLRLPRPALFMLGGTMLAAVPELPQPRVKEHPALAPGAWRRTGS